MEYRVHGVAAPSFHSSIGLPQQREVYRSGYMYIDVQLYPSSNTIVCALLRLYMRYMYCGFSLAFEMEQGGKREVKKGERGWRERE